MNSKFSLFLMLFVLFSCGSKQPTILSTTTNPVGNSTDYEPFFDILEYAPDSGYGLSENNPAKVGGIKDREGASNQRRYLATLAGPNGEILSFHRRGSCCPYPSVNGFDGQSALLDVYEVTYPGLKNPVLIYITLYDLEKLYIPKGFTKRK